MKAKDPQSEDCRESRDEGEEQMSAKKPYQAPQLRKHEQLSRIGLGY